MAHETANERRTQPNAGTPLRPLSERLAEAGIRPPVGGPVQWHAPIRQRSGLVAFFRRIFR